MVYEYIGNQFVRKAGQPGINSVCNAPGEIVLMKIEYEYKIDNILLGNRNSRVFTAEAINKCY